MTEIPKIVRERLKAGKASIAHPDADVLTAFAERSLLERERTGVLDHLSGCAECREIIALALPATEPVPALPKAPSRTWLAWPAFRWGFASAGLAAIVVFGFLQYQRHNQVMSDLGAPAPAPAHLEAKTEPLPDTLTAESKIAPQKGSKVQVFARDDSKTESKLLASAPIPSPLARQSATFNAPTRSRSTLPHGPMQATQWQQQNALGYSASNAAPAAPEAKGLAGMSAGAQPPQAAQTVTVHSQAPAIDTRAQDLGGLVVKNQPLTELQPQGGHAEAEVERAKPALIGPTKVVVDTDHLAMQSYARAVTANTPRWTINSAGALQRSFDQGVTWQNVNVMNAPAAVNALEMAAGPARAKEKDSPKLAKKDESAPPVFRTVAANGLDVWAGGAHGLLYHSTDAGAHWTHIVPSSADSVLTGDILTIEFPDTRHGKIVTSTSETWFTNDGGVSWQKP